MSGDYYIPEQSKYPIAISASMFIMLLCFGFVLNGIKAEELSQPWIVGSVLGLLGICTVIFMWMRTVIIENIEGHTSPLLKDSFYMGMAWFIFSEVAFFAAFFGSLFYVRTFVVPWIGGEGDKASTHILWESFQATWPLIQTPDPEQFPPMKGSVDPWGLPALNTFLLVTSSFFIHFAEIAMHKGERRKMNLWLFATLAFGFAFLYFQAEEYHHAWTHLMLTLNSGIYGSTFYLLTGFHGMHVTLAAVMVTVVFFRSLKGHFTKGDEFGFMAASWYWHFVDVVWIGLFFLVYVL